MLLKKWEDLPDDMRCCEVRKYYDILAHHKTGLILKRIVDIAASLLLLVLLSPLFFIITLAVTVDSRGAVFFRQVRVTAYGKRFKIIKFRSMTANAEAIGSQITANNDQRVTSVGKILRSCRLDEIPQLINILRGDMTFVGTRPEVVKFVDQYTTVMKATLLLPAGVTSETSIYYKNESKLLETAGDVDRIYVEQILPSKMYYNLRAIEKFSFCSDLRTLIRTFFIIFGKTYAADIEKIEGKANDPAPTPTPTIAFCAVSSEDLYKSRHELIQLFADKGYKILLLSPEPFYMTRYFHGNKISCQSVPMSRTGLNPLVDVKTYRTLRKIIKEIKPDILFSFSGAKAVIYATLAAATCKSTRSFCMINGLGSIYRSKSVKTKRIRLIMDVLYKSALKHSERVFFHNDDDRYVFIKLKLVNKNQCVLMNGAGVNLVNYPQTALPDQPICLFAGRLLIDKGIHDYVAAARKVKQSIPNARFIVVGPLDSNPMAIQESELNEWVNDRTVEYWGKREDMYHIYSLCKIFVLPSYHEGTPRTVLEAMAVGRPIITTDAPGCRETVINGYNGFCVSVGACDEIADCVRKLLNDNALCESMAAASRHIAEIKYDVNIINNRLYDCMTQRNAQVCTLTLD